MFEISFATDSDAFVGQDRYLEAARILRRVALSLEALQNDGPVIDDNGNRVGAWFMNQKESSQ